MADADLGGLGVLVTRPENQAAELVTAIEAAGGKAICFPVIEIVPRDPGDIARDASELPPPDWAIFVSANAVRYGIDQAGRARIAAIGPATAAAIESAGRAVAVKPAAGFDSEQLLAEPALKAVEGQNVRIVRGSAGRDLLAETLTDRGANVDYLSVYARRRPQPEPAELDRLERAWRSGGIGAVIVMSVESLHNLIDMLPSQCLERLATTLLVTPAARVLKEVLGRYPGAPAVLADGPGATDMLRAISAHATGHTS